MTRLPGQLARKIAKQVLLGVNCLHRHGIAHGDLHIHNIALDLPPAHSLSAEDFLRVYGAPEIVPVVRKDSQPIESGIPPYLVAPGTRKDDLNFAAVDIKIVDFGGAFIKLTTADEIHTPLVVRAPEAIFHDHIDTRVDLWSMACMVSERLYRCLLNRVPERWQAKWQAMSTSPTDDDPRTLQSWLEEVYLEGEGEAGLDREDLQRVGGLVRSMLRLEPMERASARQALQDEWLR